MLTTVSVSELVYRYFAAYQSRDREVVDDMLRDDFTFTSPRDDHIDKAAYFKRCWPNSDKMQNFRIEKVMEKDNEAFVRYEAERVSDGVKFRNTEYIRFEDDKIKEVDVYFGAES